MGDFNAKEFVDSIYSSYLARDFFAKVIPGGIVLGAAVLLCNTPSIIAPADLKDIPLLGWLLIYGICWGVGLAVQAIGEKFSLHRAFSGNNEAAFREKIAEFYAANPSSDNRSILERFVVLKEATSNIALATVISSILILLCKWLPNYQRWVFSTFIMVGVVFLFWFHVQHRDRQDKWLQLITKSKKNADASQDLIRS